MKNGRGVIYHAQYNPDVHHRRSIRLKGYDYSRKGAYFVTICTHERRCLFGQVQNGQTLLTMYGHVTEKCWLEVPGQFKGVELDKFVVMPNHIHGILFLNVGARFIVPNKLELDKSSPYIVNNPMILNQVTLGKIIRFFKAKTARQVRGLIDQGLINQTPTFAYFKWQRSYYEHIIRNEDELNRIRKYVMNNPLQWQFDRENPRHIPDKTYEEQWGYLEEIIYGQAKK